MRESRCIICGEKKNGLEVMDDHVINAIRWFKRTVTKNERNYNLVVCRECFTKYTKARNSYQHKEIMYTTAGAIFLALILVISDFRLSAFAAGIAITVFMYLLSQLSYMPGVRMPEVKAKK
jgi:hypothetical protein